MDGKVLNGHGLAGFGMRRQGSISWHGRIGNKQENVPVHAEKLMENKIVQILFEKIRTGQGLNYREALKADRVIAKVCGTDASDNMPRSIKIALGGNSATDFLECGLRVGLAALGIHATLHVTRYDNWVTEALEGIDVDFWVVWETAIGATRGHTERKEKDLAAIGIACRKILEKGQRMVMILPEALALEDDPFSPFRGWRIQFSRQLEEHVPEGVTCLPVDHLQRQVGAEQWFAWRYWTVAKAPCHPDAATLVAVEAAKTMAQLLVPRIKAVIADLDNTLWGGVIGDDGLDGIKLDPFGEGRAYLMMQQYLKDIQSTGIPLSVVSKNEPENARSPFQSNPWMPLSLDDFIYFDASWEPKHRAIRNITEQLNIGLDAVCFLDDSPHERAEAKKFLPELVVPELTEDPEQRVVALARSGLFFAPVMHQDDVQRVQRYREGVMRQQAQESALSLAAYHESLAMVLSPAEIQTSNMTRATALVQKTNQFNLTNRRHTRADIQEITQADTVYGYCFSLSDRFGDSGIISVVIGVAKERRLDVDTWVLSCRAFGRGVEFAILQHLMAWCQHRGIVTLNAPFSPSSKNKLVKEFLMKAGFSGEDVSAQGALDMISFTRHGLADTPKHMLTIQQDVSGGG